MNQFGDCDSSSFTSAMSLSNQGVSSIPQCYILPPSQRPNTNHVLVPTTLPIIDLSTLRDQSLRYQTINEIRIACKEVGVFQVTKTKNLMHT
jgi:hypothetical protein